jgi:hypothetical protein
MNAVDRSRNGQVDNMGNRCLCRPEGLSGACQWPENGCWLDLAQRAASTRMRLHADMRAAQRLGVTRL